MAKKLTLGVFSYLGLLPRSVSTQTERKIEIKNMVCEDTDHGLKIK